MTRFSKYFQRIGGVAFLAELMCLFFPVLTIYQENYASLTYRSIDFIWWMTGRKLEGTKQVITQNQLLLVLVTLLLPIILSLVCGVASFVLKKGQQFLTINAVIVFGLNVIFMMQFSKLFPERLNDAQKFQVGNMLWFFLVFSAIAILLEGISWWLKKNMQDSIYTSSENLREYEEVDVDDSENPLTMVNESADDSEDPLITVSEEVSGPRGVMVGVAGVFSGAEIPFRADETLKLGRDLSNDLVFPQEKRVSRFHCSITWMEQEQKFKIIDRSSNGCFVNESKECIPQNIAVYLEPNTILAIGSEENRFRLE